MLASLAGLAASAFERAVAHEESLRRQKLRRDLDLARQVQQGLLPKQPPTLPGYDVFDFYAPAQQVGGDYYDYVPLPDGRLVVVMADVSGKGVSEGWNHFLVRVANDRGGWQFQARLECRYPTLAPLLQTDVVRPGP